MPAATAPKEFQGNEGMLGHVEYLKELRHLKFIGSGGMKQRLRHCRDAANRTDRSAATSEL